MSPLVLCYLYILLTTCLRLMSIGLFYRGINWGSGTILLHLLTRHPQPAKPSLAQSAYSHHAFSPIFPSVLTTPELRPTGVCMGHGLYPLPHKYLAFLNSLFLSQSQVKPREGPDPPLFPLGSWLHHTEELGQTCLRWVHPARLVALQPGQVPVAGEVGGGPRGQWSNQPLDSQPLSDPRPNQFHTWFMGVCTEITLIFQVSS